MHKTKKIYSFSLILAIGIVSSTMLLPISHLAVQQLTKQLEHKSGEQKLQIIVKLMRVYSDLEPEIALKYGRQGLELLAHYNIPKIRVDVLNNLSKICNSLGRYEMSKEYAQEAGDTARSIEYKKGIADSLYYLGRIHYYQGIYNSAVTFLSQAKKIYEDSDNESGISQTINATGLVYWKLGDYSRALEMILESCKIRENQKGKSLEADRDIAYSYNNIGLIYYEIGDHKKAGTYLTKAKNIHETIGNKNGIAIALNNLAGIYRDQNQYKKALNYYKKSLNLNTELGYKHGAAITLKNIGKVYEKMKNYQEALNYFYKGLTISREINQQNVISDTLIYIGKIKRETGLVQEAQKFVSQGLEIALKTNSKAEIREGYHELANIYTDSHNLPKTLEYLKKYKKINDFIFNETNSQKIAELQTRYEMEKNEKEISLLKKNNTIDHLLLNRQKLFNFFISIVSFLTIVTGIIIFSRYRSKHRINLALLKEIRQHKQTTQKLLESEEKFKILAESSVVGIYILQDGIIKYVNPGFLSIFKSTIDEAMEKKFIDFIVEEDRPMVLKQINQKILGKSDTVFYEFKSQNKKGDTLNLISYGGLIYYQDKPAILETIIDITKRKKNSEKLLRSQKLEAMGIMAGGISHDFNNLLAVMVGYLEMIKDEIQIDSVAYKSIDKIEKSYNQAVELGKKMAFFAKGSWINQQKVNIISIFKSAINEFPQIATYMNTISFPDDTWSVYGDERQLKQVFLYLMKNAREVAEEDVEITQKNKPLSVSAENIFLKEENEYMLDRGKYVHVYFTDNDRIPPQGQLEKLFDPSFSTISHSDRKGMGLELAMCHSIIKKHKGHITVTVDPGKGTTFDFFLPAYIDGANNS